MINQARRFIILKKSAKRTREKKQSSAQRTGRVALGRREAGRETKRAYATAACRYDIRRPSELALHGTAKCRGGDHAIALVQGQGIRRSRFHALGIILLSCVTVGGWRGRRSRRRRRGAAPTTANGCLSCKLMFLLVHSSTAQNPLQLAVVQ